MTSLKNKVIQMNKTIENGFSFIIFGGTGDLTNRKIIPAFFQLYKRKILPNNFKIIIIGRREYTQKDYYEFLYNALSKFASINNKDDFLNFAKYIIYYKMDYLNNALYPKLKQFILDIEAQYYIAKNRIYYLASSQEHFEIIIQNLKNNHFIEDATISRLMIEKPFGKNLENAKALNELLVDTFKEENIYRVDHYLGKEMLQNILVIRFSNIIFESLWNNQFIDHIQITSSETIGIENRGKLYDSTGAIRDMLQNHMLQLLSLVAMEKPKDLTPDSIKDEKTKVLQNIKHYSIEEICENVVLGQYGSKGNIKAYREEDNVNPNSMTETFVAMRLEIDNPRWRGVNFYFRTGKRMAKKCTEIVVQFKEVQNNLYKDFNILPNSLIIKIQPMEGIIMQFNTKKPRTINTIVPVQMDFCQNCEIGFNSPEAYERLLFDVLRGDSTLFTRWDEVEISWKLIDKIIDSCKNKSLTFPNYLPGENGPKEADMLLARFNHKWHNEEDNYENI